MCTPSFVYSHLLTLYFKVFFCAILLLTRFSCYTCTISCLPTKVPYTTLISVRQDPIQPCADLKLFATPIADYLGPNLLKVEASIQREIPSLLADRIQTAAQP